MDWANTDIRDYEVVQPPGPKSAMGYVKFSFPSQHTIFMHDTPDKWMFNQGQRTLSAGWAVGMHYGTVPAYPSTSTFSNFDEPVKVKRPQAAEITEVTEELRQILTG